MPSTIYLDYNATTPMDGAVRDVVVDALDRAWGNPSSVHFVGRQARALLDDSRDRVAAVFRCKPSEIVFTGGGTEANNLAIFGVARLLRDRGRHLVCSAIEHQAVLQSFQYLADREGFSLSIVPVDRLGVVDPETFVSAIRPDTILASLMAANNETGALQPVQVVGRACRERGIIFHTDAVQWFGKEPFHDIASFEADLVALCAHKIHGPKGVGVLFVRSPLRPHPVLFGGSHEYERRAGTENLPAILGLAEAVDRFVVTPVFDPGRLRPWAAELTDVLRLIEGVAIHGPDDRKLANTVAFTVNGADSTGLLAALDLVGICASSGSACAVGSPEPSHVLQAMGVPLRLAHSLVRFSLGRENTACQITEVCSRLPEVIQQVRRVINIP